MSATLDARLVDAGLDPDEAHAKRTLFDQAGAALAGVVADRRWRLWWVPGRLEVFGTHTDYAGGRTLTAAIPRGFAVAGALQHGSRVQVIDARGREEMSIEPGEPAGPGWRRYVHAVVNRLASNFPGASRGAAIAFASDLPRASGMSSSSALVVGVATALSELWELPGRTEWRAGLRTPEDVASYFACLENGSAFGPFEGGGGVGTQGGSEDHAAIVLGRAGCLAAWSYVPMRREAEVPLPRDWCFVLAASGIPSEKTGGAGYAYNRLSEAVRRLHALWNEHEAPAGSLAAALRGGAPAVERLRSLVHKPGVPGWSAGDLLRRLDHLLLEDALVPEAVRAFERSDRSALGALSSASHEAAERLLGNQIPETVRLVGLARQCGAFAARSFGAGFGGSVWALTERAAAPALAAGWIERYRSACPGAAGAHAFAVRPGPGVVEVADSATGGQVP